MLIWRKFSIVVLLAAMAAVSAAEADVKSSGAVREWAAIGTVKELRTNDHTIVIAHEAIADYMPAMTMPFRVKDSGEMSLVRPGDTIAFRLHVTDLESWIDHIAKTGISSPESAAPAA